MDTVQLRRKERPTHFSFGPRASSQPTASGADSTRTPLLSQVTVFALPLQRKTLPCISTTSMLFIIFLLFSAMKALAQQTVSIFDYSKVAPCADSCTNIFLAEYHCKPPVAPVANYTIYKDCFCRSEYLEELYAPAELCSQTCNDNEQQGVFQYFDLLCGPRPIYSSSFPPESTTLPLVAAPTSSSLASEPTKAPPPRPGPSPSASSLLKHHGAWIHGNWKYPVIASVLVAFVAIFLSFAFLHLRRRQNAHVKSTDEGNGAIPLQTLAPPADLPRLGISGSEFSHASTENLPVTQPASPLAPDDSPHSMGNRLRAWGAAEEEREAAYAATRRLGATYAPSWELPRARGELEGQ
jgi:hypothetical protein